MKNPTNHDLASAIQTQANGLASAWSTAAEKFAERVAAEGSNTINDINGQAAISGTYGEEYSKLATKACLWIEAVAAKEGNSALKRLWKIC